MLVRADPDYTTNMPVEELLANDVLFVLKYEGQPLTPEHGLPGAFVGAKTIPVEEC